MSLKILQVSNRVPYPLNEGGNIGIYNYSRGFFEAGCDLTLIALQPKKHLNEQVDAEEVLSKFGKYICYPIDTNIKIHKALFNLFTNKSYNVERFYDKGFDLMLEMHLRDHEYDIIQIEGTYPAVYTETIKKNSSAKIILRQHNVEFQIWERLAKNCKNPIKKWYLNLLTRRLKAFEKRHLNIYDALVPVTDDDGALFKSMGCTIPIFTSPAGIDMDLWKPSGESNPFYLYHIGSLEWLPNREAVEWFIQNIWDGIKSKFPELEFFVAGKRMPDEFKNYEGNGIHMVGEVDSATEFIRNKGICVVPLLSGSGIRLKILEALSAGKLVISSTIGAQGLEYTNKKELLIADEISQYLNSLELVLENTDIREQIQEDGRRLIKTKYSNESVIDSLLNFYKGLINK